MSVVPLLAAAVALSAPDAFAATLDPPLADALRSGREVAVVVAFREGPGPPRTVAARARVVASVRARVLSRLGRHSGFTPGARWHAVMGMA
ncbi:MAG: hypothetical protein ACRDNX_07640, partial [Gaiellaceae bacterium]